MAGKGAVRRLILPAPDGTGVHVAVVGNLAHHVVDAEFIGSILRARDQRQRLDHECALIVGRHRAMVSEHGHWRVARIAIEDCKFERVNEIGVALRVVTQLAQFAFRHRANVSVGSRSSRRIASHGGSRCVANVNSYFGEAAAAGAAAGGALAVEGALIAGGSLPALDCGIDLFAALAAAFACRLHR